MLVNKFQCGEMKAMLRTTRSGRSQAVRNIVLAVGALAALASIYPGSCNAQSSDKNHPTPITGREISGRADYPVPNNGWGKTFYYIFDAGPGEVNVTVMSWSGEITSHETTPGKTGGGWFEGRFKRGTGVKPGTAGPGVKPGTTADPGAGTGVRYNLTFNEYTENHTHGSGLRKPAHPLPAVGLIAPLENGKREVSKKFILPEQTRLIMAVNVSGRFNYRIKLDGPIVGVDPH